MISDDVSLSLETSYGRENKQQYEYDQVALEIPLIHAEIEEKSPLAFEAESAVIRLKARRNELREKKKNLELELAEYSSVQEETTHE